jgi:hypothetical protein
MESNVRFAYINVQNQENRVLQTWNMELRLLNENESCNSVLEFDLIKQDDHPSLQFWENMA